MREVAAITWGNMKLRILRRWRKSKKPTTTASRPPDTGTNSPRKSQTSHQDQVRQAIDNVRSSQAPPGEVYGLTILEDNEYLVGWMNVTNSRLSSASSLHKKAMAEGGVDWRNAATAVLEGGDPRDGDDRDLTSATSASMMETSASQSRRFGKSGIELPACGRIDVQGPRIQVHFKAVNWHPGHASRRRDAKEIGPAGEIADYEE